MSTNKFDSLFNNDDQRSEIAKKREMRRKMAKTEDDPYAFVKPGKKKDVQKTDVIENIVLVENKVAKDEGKVPNIENVIYYESGKVLKPEDAFKGAGYALFIASLYRMYHDDVGYDDADIIKFSTVMTEAIRLYGPDIKVSDSVIGACSFHMEINSVNPFHALREARVSIKENVPRSVYADMVVSGDTGMIVDTVTGAVVIKEDPGLSKKATKSMGPLFQAKMSPKEEMVAVVCDLTDTNIEFVDDLEDEVKRWVENKDIPEISETQPFRSLTSVPGLLSASPVAPGNQGFYQNVYKLLRNVEKVKPDILFVPENNQAMTGSYVSLDDCSRCVPLPDDLMHASPLLASVNITDYDDVISGLRQAEITVSEDEDLKRDHSVNARSYFHSRFADEYSKYRNESHGMTRIDLKYVTLWHYKPITAQELYSEFINGSVDEYPVLMRASEYNLATSKGVNGSFIITDLPAMIGVFMTNSYVKKYVKSSLIGDTGRLENTTGFYALKDIKTGSVNVYSSWIQKYILSKFLDNLYPEKGYGKKILSGYLSYTSSGKGKTRNTVMVKTTLSTLIKCYDKIKVDPARVLSLVPNYSMKKALKYTKLMLGNNLLEKMAADVQQREELIDDDPDESGEHLVGDQDSNDPEVGDEVGLNLDDMYAYADQDSDGDYASDGHDDVPPTDAQTD